MQNKTLSFCQVLADDGFLNLHSKLRVGGLPTTEGFMSTALSATSYRGFYLMSLIISEALVFASGSEIFDFLRCH